MKKKNGKRKVLSIITAVILAFVMCASIFVFHGCTGNDNDNARTQAMEAERNRINGLIDALENQTTIDGLQAAIDAVDNAISSWNANTENLTLTGIKTPELDEQRARIAPMRTQAMHDERNRINGLIEELSDKTTFISLRNAISTVENAIDTWNNNEYNVKLTDINEEGLNDARAELLVREAYAMEEEVERINGLISQLENATTREDLQNAVDAIDTAIADWNNANAVQLDGIKEIQLEEERERIATLAQTEAMHTERDRINRLISQLHMHVIYTGLRNAINNIDTSIYNWDNNPDNKPLAGINEDILEEGRARLRELSPEVPESLRVVIRPQAATFLGEAPNLTGGVLEVTTTRGTVYEVPMDSDEIVVSPAVVHGEPQLNFPVSVRYGTVSVETYLGEVLEPIEVPDGMVLTFSDEFSGDRLNYDNWEYQIGTGTFGPNNPWGNWELQFYSERNVSVDDGTLSLRAKADDVVYEWLAPGPYNRHRVLTPEEAAAARAAGTRIDTHTRVGGARLANVNGRLYHAEFSSGRIRSQHLFYQTFGRFEARMRIPAFMGSWNAFWMMPERNIFPTGGVWPRSGEIDIMENRGSNPTYVGQAVHMSVGNPGQHRMLFNQQGGINTPTDRGLPADRRIRQACFETMRAFTTYGEYNLVFHGTTRPSASYIPPGATQPVPRAVFQNGNRFYTLGERIDYHFITYAIEWRPDVMIWYNGWYNDDGEKEWLEVYRLMNWRNPGGGSGGWTGWRGTSPRDDISGVPTNYPTNTGAVDPVSGLTVGSLNTAYLLTRRPSAPFDHNFHLILNMAIGGQFDPPNVWNVPVDLDVTTKVDYVRAFQFKDLIPDHLWIETVPPAREYRVGQMPSLAGGVLGASFPDGSEMSVLMSDARIIRYRVDTVSENGFVVIDFRGAQIEVPVGRVIP